MLCPGEYVTMIRSKDHSFDLRKTLVRVARARGIRAAAREFSTSRNTVRTWVRRFEAEHWQGLRSRSTRPKTSPRRLAAAIERRVLEARRRSGFGAARLVEEFDLSEAEVGRGEGKGFEGAGERVRRSGFAILLDA